MKDSKSAFRLFLGLAVVCIVAAVTTYVTGGDLNPGNTPSPTMRTLDEIYKNIQPGLPSDWIPYPSEPQITDGGAILMEATGQMQGAIHGSSKDGMVRIIGLGHQITSPRDAASGLPTGKRQHSPLIISKYVDCSSPLIYRALVDNENLTHVYFRFFQKGADGRSVQYYTIHLTGASVCDIKTAYPNIEQISFVYQHIEWIWEDGGVTAEDDWETPVA